MLIRIEDSCIDKAIQAADIEENITNAARCFRDRITSVLRVAKAKQRLLDSKWTGVLGNFLGKLYPLIKIFLQLTGTFAEVRWRLDGFSEVGCQFPSIKRFGAWIRNHTSGLPFQLLAFLV